MPCPFSSVAGHEEDESFDDDDLPIPLPLPIPAIPVPPLNVLAERRKPSVKRRKTRAPALGCNLISCPGDIPLPGQRNGAPPERVFPAEPFEIPAERPEPVTAVEEVMHEARHEVPDGIQGTVEPRGRDVGIEPRVPERTGQAHGERGLVEPKVSQAESSVINQMAEESAAEAFGERGLGEFDPRPKPRLGAKGRRLETAKARPEQLRREVSRIPRFTPRTRAGGGGGFNIQAPNFRKLIGIGGRRKMRELVGIEAITEVEKEAAFRGAGKF